MHQPDRVDGMQHKSLRRPNKYRTRGIRCSTSPIYLHPDHRGPMQRGALTSAMMPIQRSNWSGQHQPFGRPER
jgi:hypothetical protein